MAVVEGGGGISVTLKSDEPGGKFNDPKSPGTWIVFHGTPAEVRAQIMDVFQPGSDFDSRPLFELVHEATRLFKATANVSGILGGSVIAAAPAAAPAAASGSASVWDQAAPSAPTEPEAKADPILEALAAARTVADVQQVWAENQSLFNGNADYMDAYKKRGKELS